MEKEAPSHQEDIKHDAHQVAGHGHAAPDQ
jgi:hypothetical protein